jgi:hypothetical protein
MKKIAHRHGLLFFEDDVKKSAKLNKKAEDVDDYPIIEDQLSNNEVSSDEEIVEHWIESGVPENLAKEAIQYRDYFSLNIDLAETLVDKHPEYQKRIDQFYEGGGKKPYWKDAKLNKKVSGKTHKIPRRCLVRHTKFHILLIVLNNWLQ